MLCCEECPVTDVRSVFLCLISNDRCWVDVTDVRVYDGLHTEVQRQFVQSLNAHAEVLSSYRARIAFKITKLHT